MATHNDYGKEGERLAAGYLAQQGFEILFKNWRYGRNEIDIVAFKDNTVHFVEVKTRHESSYGYPEQSVSRKKFRCIKIAATAFQVKYPLVKKIRFDILSITHTNRKETEYFFIEDVYM